MIYVLMKEKINSVEILDGVKHIDSCGASFWCRSPAEVRVNNVFEHGSKVRKLKFAHVSLLFSQFQMKIYQFDACSSIEKKRGINTIPWCDEVVPLYTMQHLIQFSAYFVLIFKNTYLLLLSNLHNRINRNRKWMHTYRGHRKSAVEADRICNFHLDWMCAAQVPWNQHF